MSDETTELLREGLTKRGIEWRSGLEGVTFVGDWCFVEYDNGKLAATCEPVLTPEQAIAATLGSGALAIEQIKDAVLKNFHYDRLKPPLFDWQAIADELNAKLGSGTCEKLPSLTDTVCIVRMGGMERRFGYWRCSKCGCENVEGAKHCMNCGRKVVSA